MSTWLEELKKMVADCEEQESRLNDRERTFIDSLTHQLDQIDPSTIFKDESIFTPKQVKWLMDIHERICPDGC